MTSRAAEQFARVIIEMAPYADEIVFVGGWVHALYLTEGDPRFAVPIAGQPGLLAQGYPGQNVLLQNTRSMRSYVTHGSAPRCSKNCQLFALAIPKNIPVGYKRSRSSSPRQPF